MKGNSMNEFIQKNRRLLKIYNYMAYIMGWILIVLTPILSYILILNSSGNKTKPLAEIDRYYFILSIHSGIVNYFCLGIILLTIARFIKYLYSEESRPDWILRHFVDFISIYALLIVIGISIKYMDPSFHKKGMPAQNIGATLLPQIIIDFAKAFIVIGLGHIMSRVLPVIEESKTLV